MNFRDTNPEVNMLRSKTMISFGLVAVSVTLYTAVTDSDVRFNQRHKPDGGRIRYKKVCSHCQKEVQNKDKYVVIDDNEIEKTIQI